MKLKLLFILLLAVCLNMSSQNSFITKWGTISDNEKIYFATAPGTSGYDYTIDWGDGTIQNNLTSTAEHTYVTKGSYDITITGDYPKINLKGQSRLLEVKQWGTNTWISMADAFNGSKNFKITASDTPNLSKVTDMSNMFYNATSFEGDLSNWDVSTITNMDYIFSWARSFDSDISNWNVSNVTSMIEMFYNSDAFNQDLNKWDVSKVENMRGMFAFTDVFNGDISNWSTANVIDMGEMFSGTKQFNRSLNLWNVSSVTNFESMFNNASKFNQDLSSWDLSSAIDLNFMFANTPVFNSNLSSWNVSNVTNMYGIFMKAAKFNSNISNWNVSKVINMTNMFRETLEFNQNIGNWDVSKVTSMFGMFNKAKKFNQDIGNWNVGSVTNMSSMFAYTDVFNQDIGNWNVSEVVDMSNMFVLAIAFNQNLGNWNISKTRSMPYMFDGAKLSTDNYDKLLIGWNSLPSVQESAGFNAGSSTFCTSQTERDALIAKGFGITDGGKDCSTSTLSVENDILADSFRIFPNPVLNYLEIKSKNNFVVESIKVYNLQGALIEESTQNKIDLSSLSLGAYIVKIKSDKGVFSKKIVKKD